MYVHDYDAEYEGIAPSILAEYIVKKTGEAINSYRYERSWLLTGQKDC